MEVEYRGIVNIGIEVVLIQYLLYKHGFPIKEPISIYYDNHTVI